VSLFVGVREFGGDVSEIERWRMAERERVKNQQERLIKERSDLVRRFFYDAVGHKVTNPPEEAVKEVQRLETELARIDQELRDIDTEADRRRYAPLDVETLAEQCKAELEELRRQRRVYSHRVYILRYTPELQNLTNIEERMSELQTQIERYELAASARGELAKGLNLSTLDTEEVNTR
jgi:hypothetical protein